MKNSEKHSSPKKQSEIKGENENLPYNPNITEHDKDILSQKNIHGDGGDDQQLRDRKQKVDFEGKDLDVPGRSQAKKSNGNGLRDEENKLFSQGGEDNESLEQDKQL
ncbi:hypothetical protein [Aequorivita lipolytica]|uniref:Uncharacterized protein n=1 Tax=Aequorivita lipolytica TaxID=153267 RepID=A0A5C6YQC8_9FLAO|nr:hypothetical protein [Aequorivita lipolytica]TXD69145.1 hypothetical protein ESV24_08875 [Aequorivita lipolytica]SRX51275.1 hypothetical protein AEQU2_01755 [Aequorivita lipolytica]